MDLADIADPRALARALHRQIGQLSGPIPVKEIALALDIEEVREEEMDGCEGMLLTDRRRTRGKIAVNMHRGRQAARFGIGHELGHFLMERHELGLHGVLRCSLDDMRQSRSLRKHRQQEVEANEFAIGLLAPDHVLAAMLGADPEIEVAMTLRRSLDLSLEASTRCLVERHDEPLAAVWAKDGVIRYVIRGPSFPWITWSRGDRIPTLSRTRPHLALCGTGVSRMSEVAPAAWTNADLPELFEQVRIGRDGHSLTLLWATLPEASEGED